MVPLDALARAIGGRNQGSLVMLASERHDTLLLLTMVILAAAVGGIGLIGALSIRVRNSVHQRKPGFTDKPGFLI